MRESKNFFRCLWILALSMICVISIGACSFEGKSEELLQAEKWLEKVPDEASDNYYYENICSLNDAEAETYALIYEGIENMNTNEIALTITDTDRISEIVRMIVLDEPAFFWYETYVLTIYSGGEDDSSVGITLEFNCTEQERDERHAQINNAVENILADAPEGTDVSDYDNVKYIHDYIVENTDYVLDSDNSQNISSVFINRESVCQGYALACDYLLEQMGISAITITGMTDDGELHAWNIVWVNGDPYYMDATWDDPQYAESDGNDSVRESINWDYFLITSEEMAREHTADDFISESLPECTAVSENYYVREGLLFTEWSETQFQSIIADAVSSGSYKFSVKFSSIDIMREAYEDLFTNGNISTYIRLVDGTENLTALYYSPSADTFEDHQMYVLTVRFA